MMVELYEMTCVENVTTTGVRHDRDEHFQDCLELVTLTPMYRQGGLTGAWYPVDDLASERPDGWLYA